MPNNDSINFALSETTNQKETIETIEYFLKKINEDLVLKDCNFSIDVCFNNPKIIIGIYINKTHSPRDCDNVVKILKWLYANTISYGNNIQETAKCLTVYFTTIEPKSIPIECNYYTENLGSLIYYILHYKYNG